MPVTPVLDPAAEVGSAYPAQVGSTHRAAEAAAAHRAAEVPSTDPSAEVASTAATAACKRVSGNASTSHRYGGNDDRDSVQHNFLHGSAFLL